MTENGILVSSPSADDLTSNGDNSHKIQTTKIITKTAKMPDRLAPPDVCHRHHQHKKRFGYFHIHTFFYFYFIKLALSQKRQEDFYITKISIPNHYPQQKI